MFLHKLLSTGLGIGYIGKGSGTVAAVATCVVWYYAQVGFPTQIIAPLLVTLLITLQGIRSANVVEAIWGKDHQRVVIDEIAGMCITLIFIPLSPKYIFTGLLLFRFFDIVKPLFIRRLEAWPGGLGVMADDVLAGIYANIILQLIIIFNIF